MIPASKLEKLIHTRQKSDQSSQWELLETYVIIVLNVKAVGAAFNQEEALVGAFSVITNLRMQLFEALGRTNTAPDPVSWPGRECRFREHSFITPSGRGKRQLKSS